MKNLFVVGVFLFVFILSSSCFSSPIILIHEKTFSVRDGVTLLTEDSIASSINTISAWEDQAFIEYNLSTITDNVEDANFHFTLFENITPSPSSSVDIHVYSGNGNADVADWNTGTFLEAVVMPAISTTDPGKVSFSVDVTATLNELINLSATHIGFRFSNVTPDGQYFLRSDVNTYLEITPESALEVAIDIKPSSCPNPLNVNSKGVFSVAILGSEELDVTTINVASVRLTGVAPIRNSYEDVATPVSNGNECDCTEEGPDGYLDLTLKFEIEEIADALGEVVNGEVLLLTLTGELNDGTPIEGEDCIRVKKRRAR